jgi:hypothetical protein
MALGAWWLNSLAGAARGRKPGLMTRAGLVAPWLYYLLLRRRMLFWGATREEILEELPGDEIVANPTKSQTRAITIDAAPDEVWRWLVQIGYGRGGWYSYDALEAAAGAGDFVEGHSATRIHPELQEVRTGDVIRMSPWTGHVVASSWPGKALVLRSEGMEGGLMPKSTWAMVLRRAGENRTRLLIRDRTEVSPHDFAASLLDHLIEAPHSIMERRMMLGLKQRAEQVARCTPGANLIDGIIADRRFSDTIAVTVNAPAQAIFDAFGAVTVEDMPLANILGTLRYLPGKLTGHAQPAAAKGASFAEGLEQGGWVKLAEDPGREQVFGGAGKYHQVLDQEPRPFRSAADFFAFDDPQYQKLAISVRVEAGEKPGENRLVLEHRTHALSENARKGFARYWRVIKPTGAFVSRQLLLAAKHRAERQ